MENLIKNLVVKLIVQLNYTFNSLSYCEVSNYGEFYIRGYKPHDIILENKLITLLYDLQKTQLLNIEIEVLNREEISYRFTFDQNYFTEKKVESLESFITDLNEIIRSFTHKDFTMSSSAVELLELGKV